MPYWIFHFALVTFRFGKNSFRFVSVRFDSFRFYFVSHLTGTLNNNIWYKYTGITWQKDKYLMADKKLRIPRKLKTETHKQLKIRTDMNSDAPYESAIRTSLIPLHGRKNWEQLIALPTFKNSFAHFLALNLRKKSFFTLVWKHILSI